MVRGVEFEILQKTADTLWEMLNCINIETYKWYIIDSQEEVWNEEQNEDFFTTQDLSGKDFAEKIHSNHYIVFLKLQAYLTDGVFSDVQTYDEFLKGDCKILVLVNDCEYVEIYCKDRTISEVIYNHAISKKYKNVKYITNDNDHRTIMNVL